ncbi:MAG: type III polyketide synthase [Planctomycetota bacterium]
MNQIPLRSATGNRHQADVPQPQRGAHHDAIPANGGVLSGAQCPQILWCPQILGLGAATPRWSATDQQALEFAKRRSCTDASQHRTVDVLYRRTGIQNRGSVLLRMGEGSDLPQQDFYPEITGENDGGPSTRARMQRYAAEAPGLAITAAKRAMENAAAKADQISHLVTVSCTGFSAPGFDIDLIEKLHLPGDVQRVQVGFMGCHGAINGLRVADAIARADPDARVLLCSVELCSLHYQYGYDPDRIVSGALFADGAAAMVIGGQHQNPIDGEHQHPTQRWAGKVAPHSPGKVAHDAFKERSNAALRIVKTGSRWIPESRDAMTWKIADHGFEMTLSAQVPDLIRQRLPAFIDDFLAGTGLGPSENDNSGTGGTRDGNPGNGHLQDSCRGIGGWAVHPGGPRILDAVQSGLQLPASALQISREVLREHGNMSSATMPILLRKFQDRSIPTPWLMLGFGPGLEIEAALIA